MNADADRIENKFLADAWDVRKPIGQTFNPFLDDLKDAPSKTGTNPPKEDRKRPDNEIFNK